VSRPAAAAGIFETVLVEGGRALWLDRHLARLRASALAVYGAAPGTELDADIARVVATAGDERCRLRIVVAPGAAPAVTLTPLGAAASRAPVALRPWTLPGGLGAHKWVDRRLVDAAHARLGATPLIVEPDGEVLEAAWANVWVLEGRRLLTPPADGRLLPGVTRARVLERAGDADLEAGEAQLSLERLAGADAIVLTSALRLAVAAHIAPAGPQGEDVAQRMAAALAEPKPFP
jgi:para-aminobenzoate synthetase / 4-amino-4-deoxychorismate lyase